MKTVTLKSWVHDEAARCGVRPISVYQRLRSGHYPALSVIRLNPRVVFVELTPWPATYQAIPEGDVRLKEWVVGRASIDRVSKSAIWMRIARGKYPDLKVTRVSRAVAYVSSEA